MRFFKATLLLVSVTFFVLGCASLESTSGDRSVTYDRDFNTMVETAERAIRGSSLNISFAQKSDDGKKYTIVFNARAALNTQSVQQDEGEMIVENIGENQTKIIINNPEYHFSVPSHQRKEYDRILKNRIDDILGL